MMQIRTPPSTYGSLLADITRLTRECDSRSRPAMRLFSRRLLRVETVRYVPLRSHIGAPPSRHASDNQPVTAGA